MHAEEKKMKVSELQYIEVKIEIRKRFATKPTQAEEAK